MFQDPTGEPPADCNEKNWNLYITSYSPIPTNTECNAVKQVKNHD